MDSGFFVQCIPEMETFTSRRHRCSELDYTLELGLVKVLSQSHERVYICRVAQ